MEPYTFSQQLTEEEYAKHSFDLLPQRRQLVFLLGAGLVLIPWAFWSNFHENLAGKGPVLFLVFATIGIYLPFGFRQAVKRAFRASTFLRNSVTYTITNDGVEARGVGASFQVAWDVYKTQREKEGMVLLYNASGVAITFLKKEQFTPKALDFIRYKLPPA